MENQHKDDDLTDLSATVGPDLNTMLVFNLLRTHGCLSSFVDADLRGQNLTASQLNALLVLRAAGPEGLLMSEIGRRLVVTKSNVTGLVDRLERQGLVERTDHDDRRATVVRLTAEGAKRIDEAAPRHAERLTELTGCFTDEEKRTLIQLLSRLRRELRHRRGEDK